MIFGTCQALIWEGSNQTGIETRGHGRASRTLIHAESLPEDGFPMNLKSIVSAVFAHSSEPSEVSSDSFNLYSTQANNYTGLRSGVRVKESSRVEKQKTNQTSVAQ